jgi:uncharacterized membrane protein YoaK (UPF0700 family)
MLGLLLAFNASAINAAGFLVLHMYTSHMTGFASQLADGLVLGNTLLLTPTWPTPFDVPLTVLLLSFMMGLQNAVGSKTSGGSVRTTHMTGNITDLGMELGKMIYWNRRSAGAPARVRHDRQRMKLAAGLVGMFVAGGTVGALGFKYVGFVFVIPLAVPRTGLPAQALRWAASYTRGCVRTSWRSALSSSASVISPRRRTTWRTLVPLA